MVVIITEHWCVCVYVGAGKTTTLTEPNKWLCHHQRSGCCLPVQTGVYISVCCTPICFYTTQLADVSADNLQ